MTNRANQGKTLSMLVPYAVPESGTWIPTSNISSLNALPGRHIARKYFFCTSVFYGSIEVVD
jgi:hypothetical protein